MVRRLHQTSSMNTRTSVSMGLVADNASFIARIGYPTMTLGVSFL
jgi:hypothetical protein